MDDRPRSRNKSGAAISAAGRVASRAAVDAAYSAAVVTKLGVAGNPLSEADGTLSFSCEFWRVAFFGRTPL